MTISDQELLDRYPWATITHDNKEQWRGFLERRLVVNRCQDCCYWINEPRPLCPKCWSTNVRPEAVSGRGRVQWFSLNHQGPAIPEHDYSRPYPVVTVELEEQVNLRISSTVVNCELERIQCDLPVHLTWQERQGAPLPVFEPDEGATP
jgi:uncharacterized OB-fold protein